jgi:class 3 adenylate cyclase
MSEENDNKPEESKIEDLDELLKKRQSLDKLFEEKFQRILTVMFTDLKGSTTIAEKEGDLSSRLLIKDHNEIVLGSIKDHNGVLVKTMGDGTMSYFESAMDAVRTGADIQRKVESYNVEKKTKVPILIRIGIHTGECIVEENDIFGDTVNVASRFESSANPGEIYLSEDTYNAMEDKGEIYCRYIKSTTLKGKSEECNIYKAFWDEKEIEREITVQPTAEPEKKSKSMMVAVAVVILIVIVSAVLFLGPKVTKETSKGERRSIEHSTSVPENSSP